MRCIIIMNVVPHIYAGVLRFWKTPWTQYSLRFETHCRHFPFHCVPLNIISEDVCLFYNLINQGRATNTLMDGRQDKLQFNRRPLLDTHTQRPWPIGPGRVSARLLWVKRRLAPSAWTFDVRFKVDCSLDFWYSLDFNQVELSLGEEGYGSLLNYDAVNWNTNKRPNSWMKHIWIYIYIYIFKSILCFLAVFILIEN